MKLSHKIVWVLGLLCLIALNSSCKADTPRKVLNGRETDRDTTFCYTIGGYQICPESRLIQYGHMVGGVNWDGWAYSPDETVNYDTTTLMFLGGYIDFIEHFKGIDFGSLKVLSPMYFQDNKGVYLIGYRQPSQIISLEGKTKISECLYQDKDGIYTLNATSGYPKLNPISHLDFDTLHLQYIVDDYFVDKNGLYSFAGYTYSDGIVNTYQYGKKLESFDGITIPKIEIHESYIVVNDIIYTRLGNEFHKMELDASNTKEFLIHDYYQTYLITDGRRAYRFSKHYQGDKFEEVSAMKGLSLGKIIGLVKALSFNKHTQAIYMGGYDDTIAKENIRKGLTPVRNQNVGLLFVSDDGTCSVLDSDLKVTKYTNWYVYNATTKAFELADLDDFRILGKYMYAYKDWLYLYHGSYSNSVTHVRETFDTKKFREFEQNGIVSNFIEDGKTLLYNGEVTSYQGGLSYGIVKKDYIAANVDFSTLEIITPDILMDKNTIYIGGYVGLNVIPKNKLGIKINVYK